MLILINIYIDCYNYCAFRLIGNFYFQPAAGHDGGEVPHQPDQDREEGQGQKEEGQLLSHLLN